jgi:hypothetical protein
MPDTPAGHGPLAVYLSEIGLRYAYVKAAARSGFGAGEAARNSADDVPPLLKVAEAVLEVHKPLDGDWGRMCSYCWTRGGGRRVWPCPELLKVAAVLLGEEAPDDRVRPERQAQ